MMSTSEKHLGTSSSATTTTTTTTTTDDEYLDTFPKGYRFIPTDEEVLDYLNLRVEKKPLPPNRINEVNLYDHHPEYLTSAGMYKAYENKEWYFFTPRDRKYRNGHRPKRAAGNGFWKATGVDKEILWDNDKKKPLGSKKTLVFYEGKPPKGTKTCWVMHEFKVHKSSIEKNSRADMRLDDCVLCRIHIKKNKSTDNTATTSSGSRKRRPVYHDDYSLSSLAIDDDDHHHPQVLNDQSNISSYHDQQDHLQEEEDLSEVGAPPNVYNDEDDYLCLNYYDSIRMNQYPIDHILNNNSLCSVSTTSIMGSAVASSSTTTTVVREPAVIPLQTHHPSCGWPVLNDLYVCGANSTTACPDMVSMSTTHNSVSHNNNIRQVYQIQQCGYSDTLMNNQLSSSVPGHPLHPPPPQVFQPQGYNCRPPPLPQMPQMQQHGYDHRQYSQIGNNNIDGSSSGNKLHNDHAIVDERPMVFKKNDDNIATEHGDYYSGVNLESFVTPFSTIYNGIGTTLPGCGWSSG